MKNGFPPEYMGVCTCNWLKLFWRLNKLKELQFYNKLEDTTVELKFKTDRLKLTREWSMNWVQKDGNIISLTWKNRKSVV